MLQRYRYWLTNRIPGLIYHFVRAYSWTFRVQIENERPWLDYLQDGGRVLLCGWHQQFFAAIHHFKTYASYRPALMISQSKDGDIIAGIAEKSGWHTVRGSSSRNGGRALKEMVGQLQLTGLAAHVVDGPKGPAGIIKAWPAPPGLSWFPSTPRPIGPGILRAGTASCCPSPSQR
jgi:lysophospholipid acyltransferase (LPLAT)-like uncharacterized protein